MRCRSNERSQDDDHNYRISSETLMGGGVPEGGNEAKCRGAVWARKEIELAKTMRLVLRDLRRERGRGA